MHLNRTVSNFYPEWYRIIPLKLQHISQEICQMVQHIIQGSHNGNVPQDNLRFPRTSPYSRNEQVFHLAVSIFKPSSTWDALHGVQEVMCRVSRDVQQMLLGISTIFLLLLQQCCQHLAKVNSAYSYSKIHWKRTTK